MAATLAAAGVAAMMASELLPWTTLHYSNEGTNTDSNPLGPTGTLSLGLDRLQTFEGMREALVDEDPQLVLEARISERCA